MDCVGHQERLDLDSYIERKLEERELTVVDYDGFLNVNTGPNYKKLTLREVQNSYKKSVEWKKITKSFYCIPNLEKRDFKTKKKKKEIIAQYEKLLLEKTKAMAEECMQRDKEFKHYEAVLTTETELSLRELILKSMDGSPGLLLRSVETDKVVSQDKMENLCELSDLGIKIPLYNCQDPQHTQTCHTDQCFRSESDFILLYVDGAILCI